MNNAESYERFPMSKGGTLKPADQRTAVYHCPAHGDYLGTLRHADMVLGQRQCPNCYYFGTFKGYTADSEVAS